LNILLDEGGPVGGRWSFDPLNRRKIPKDFPLSELPQPKKNGFIAEAQTYVDENFPYHPGTTDNFVYPVTTDDTETWLDDFLVKRIVYFGDFQDAIVHDHPFLFHSVLTPMLNIGLIDPGTVVEKTLAFAETHPVPLNSLEGFIRQIIGWREFMRAIYVQEGQHERDSNFWGHTRKVAEAFYTGQTGILPVDAVIQRVNDWAYTHHIERLMILGNFMLLCEFDPFEVYRWFMEMFVDAYDWVMVPNVFGMSQYADGGLITTKPYISSSNYVRKMSDFPKGDWCPVWDGLYWRFIRKHHDFFDKSPRMKIMANQLARMNKDKLAQHLSTADSYLGTLE
jgi:deoxyribodipyrimidine photolyase-related protein